MSGELKDITVLLDGSESGGDAKIALALQLTRQHGAQVTGLYVGAPDEWIAAEAGIARGYPVGGLAPGLPLYGVQSVRPPDENTGSRRSSGASDSEEFFRETAGTGGHWTSAASLEEALKEIRCADLVIVGQADPNVASRIVASVDEVAVQAGRPLLILPYIFSSMRPEEQRIGSRVLVAWNGSSEASRAVHDALPFLKEAEAVTVLAIDEHDGEPDSETRIDLDRLLQHLAHHGAKAMADVESSLGLKLADLILNRIADLSCDLLVMGAYSRGRLRESWFGGASRDLFQHMTVPVLTAH